MKKGLAFCVALMIALSSVAFAADAYDLEIGEKVFIAMTNDIYMNTDEYFGKSIRYEGMFFSSTYGEGNDPFYMVIRYGPGCCGDDGSAGFEVTMDGLGIEPPADNAWVEVVGTPEWYEEDGTQFLRMRVTSLRELETRGMETVLQ